MFKIVTDPTVYPIREVDLTSAAGGLTLTPTASGRSRDLTFQRSDGGLNVARRARRTDLELEAAVLEAAQTTALQEVLGLTSGGAPRVPAYLFPPFDASTVVSIPFQGSRAAWLRDPTTQTLQKTDVAFSRATIGQATDKWGRFYQVAANVPRFLPDGPLGRAVYIGSGSDNLCANAHPTAANLLWTPGAGTPTVEWTSDKLSPYTAAGGCVRVRRAKGSSCQVSISNVATVSASLSTRIRYSVWIYGTVAGYLKATLGAQATQTGTQKATGNGWTRWDVEFAKNDAATTFTILLSIQDDGTDRGFYIGPHLVHEYPDSGDIYPPMHWELGNVNKDDYGIIVPNNPGQLTISCASKIPVRGQLCRLWNLGGGVDSISALWWTSTPRLTVSFSPDPSLQLYPPTAEWNAAEGRPYVHTLRIGWNAAQDGIHAESRVAYTLTDGGPVRRWSVSLDPASVGDYLASTDLTLGSFGNYDPMELGLSWFRYDGRRWADLELEVWERCILEAGFRDVFSLTQGRQFLLGDLETETIPGTQYQRATLTAQESSVDSDFAVIT